MWGAFIAKNGEKAVRMDCFVEFNSGKVLRQDAF